MSTRAVATSLVVGISERHVPPLVTPPQRRQDGVSGSPTISSDSVAKSSGPFSGVPPDQNQGSPPGNLAILTKISGSEGQKTLDQVQNPCLREQGVTLTSQGT